MRNKGLGFPWELVVFAALSLDPVILWTVGNYTPAQEGGRGGARRLNIDAISRKSGVREDTDQSHARDQFIKTREPSSSQKHKVPGARRVSGLEQQGPSPGGDPASRDTPCKTQAQSQEPALSFVSAAALSVAEISEPGLDTGPWWVELLI